MDDERTLEPGEVLLGKYRVDEKVGEGGVAVIYKATRIHVMGTARPVVLKVIKPELTSSPEIVRQFAQETSVGRALQHPNIVEFLDMGDDEDMLLMVLEYVAGKDLGALVHRVSRSKRVLRPELIAYITLEVSKALECSHGHTEDGAPAPVIHRDVSPQNILLGFDGRVKLADFGMARALNMARQTQYGVIKGKLSYMSPEQSTGADVDARSDIFSLGIVMWESLCARRLFLRKKQIETIFAVRDARVPPLAKVAPHVPAELASIVHKALSKEKEERFQSASEMRWALEQLLARSEPVDAEALSGVLAAYFPDEHEAAMAAEPVLSYDDETDDARDFDIDDAPPEIDEGPTGLVAANTIMMDREAMAADLERAMAEAMQELEEKEQQRPSAPPAPDQPPSPSPQQQPAAQQGQPQPSGGWPAVQQGQPPPQPQPSGGWPAVQQGQGQPQQYAGGWPAAQQGQPQPSGGWPAAQQGQGQPQQYGSGGWPAAQPGPGQQYGSGGWPAAQPGQGQQYGSGGWPAAPGASAGYPSVGQGPPRKQSLFPLLVILLIGLPLSALVGVVVYFLLNR